VANEESIDIIADPIDKIACRECGRHLDVSKIASFATVECPDCKTKQPVPAQLGQFLLLEQLGAGGMGAVYRALDQSLGRYVAIKVMKQSLGDDVQFVENFMREARAAAALNHRNVVQIYSCGQEKGQPYIVMELVSGGRMDEEISDGNPMDEVRALEVGVDVAEGLRAANDIGLIHGDIKPANILFDKEGVAKVADFGLARFLDWQESERTEIWGTPYYIAPEKARGQKVDHRSDIYSLGATLYHALGAKPPFDGKTATDVVLARLKNPAIGLRVIRPTLQPETAEVVARTLEADPFMRYPTYSSLLADLREALRIAKQEHRTVRSKARKSPVLPFLVVFAIIIAAGVILVAGLRWANVKQKEQKKIATQSALAKAQQTVLAASTNEVTVSLKQPRIAPILQPFNKKGEASLAKAMKKLSENRVTAAKDQLQSLYDQSSELGMGRYWIRLFQSITAWIGGNDQDAMIYLNEVRTALFEPLGDGQPHPGNMPQAIARYMYKEIDDGTLSFEAANWPPWYGDLTEFFMGMDQLRSGSLTQAKSFFESYIGRSGEDPAWPYLFQPIAKNCIKEISAFQKVKQKSDELVASKRAAKAKTVLQDFRFKTLPLLYPVIDERISMAEGAQREEEREEQLAQRKIHRGKVQADIDRLDAVRTRNLMFVTKKDFRKAAAAVTKLTADMQTNEGQQSLILCRESYDRMAALKKFLISRISASSYRGKSDLGGTASAADVNGIRVALGQHGAMVVPWDQVSIRTFLQLSNYYLTDKSLSEKKRADMTVSTAIFCYENARFKWAEKLVERAAKLDPGIKTKIRQLMPGMLKE